jgi:hypothetical protein
MIFVSVFEPLLNQMLLPEVSGQKLPKSRLTLSEIMIILIGFHGSRYRTFKEFYNLEVIPGWSKSLPNLVSYNRFVELMSRALLGLGCYFHSCRLGSVTGVSFIDSTGIKLCHNFSSPKPKGVCRASRVGQKLSGFLFRI